MAGPAGLFDRPQDSAPDSGAIHVALIEQLIGLAAITRFVVGIPREAAAAALKARLVGGASSVYQLQNGLNDRCLLPP